MPERERTALWLAWRLAAASMIASTGLQSARGTTMNPQITLYQFLQNGDRIAITRISRVDIQPGARGGQERVNVDLRVIENLADKSGPAEYSFVFDRPANQIAQLKFPDPVWGRVDLRTGAGVLLVTGASPGQNPVYAEGIPTPDDPVFQSIRGVVKAERAAQSDAERFDRRLQWLASGDEVQKLFAGEALAKGGGSEEQMSRVIAAFGSAFAGEHDAYVKISLGTWLWEDIYPRTADEAGRVAIVNITIGGAASENPNVRRFVIDRIAGVDPGLLGKPGVRPSRELISQLEDRRRAESSAEARAGLDRVIAAFERR